MKFFGSASVVAAIHHHHHTHDQTFLVTMHTTDAWRRDCGKKVRKHQFAFAQSGNSDPGAGMAPEDIEPYDTIYKDGFLMVGCVKDAMYEVGDKFGNNKYNYKMGPVANSSIVHYTEHIAKEDRKAMTHAVCFEFCRGIPDMGFFGISNGRDCYCTSFYKPMASDSSECDAVCEGDNALMCGGKSKNSVFSMHMCADSASELATSLEGAEEVLNGLEGLAKEVEETASEGKAAADALQKSFSVVGDPVASGLMQDAKVWAGKLLDSAAEGTKFVAKMRASVEAGEGLHDGDFSQHEHAKKAEDSTKALDAASVEGAKIQNDLAATYQLASPDGPDTGSDTAKQYYPLMYFVDKAHETVPTTCGGDGLGQPIFGKDAGQCAAACDDLVGECVGFAFFEKDSSVCFLFSKFKSTQYYTGCVAEGGFLQTGKVPFQAKCFAKLSRFEGTTLKPDPEGKCDLCLTEATKADRCFA